MVITPALDNFSKNHNPLNISDIASNKALDLWEQFGSYPDTALPERSNLYNKPVMKMFEDIWKNGLGALMKKQPVNAAVDWAKTELVLLSRQNFALLAAKLLALGQPEYLGFAYALHVYSMLPLVNARDPSGFCFMPLAQLPCPAVTHDRIHAMRWIEGLTWATFMVRRSNFTCPITLQWLFH